MLPSMQIIPITLANTAGTPTEVAGVPDGPDLVMPSGIRLQRQQFGASRVLPDQLRDAVRGVLKLPMADQHLVASIGFAIELVPVPHLEQVQGSVDPVVGATRVVGPDGSIRAERVRIATLQEMVGTEVEECVQHELGHVVAVHRSQDTSEQTAIAYAARY